LALSPHFTAERLAGLSVESALARRDHAPGAGSASVAAQLARHEARLGLGAGEKRASRGPQRSKASGGVAEASLRGPQRSRASGGVADASEAMDGASEPRLSEPPLGATASVPPDALEREGPSNLPPEPLGTDLTLRHATLDDVPGIARLMADFVAQGVLLPRPVGELYQCVREFHVVERAATNGDPPEIVACAALRLLWDDLGEVRSLAVRPDHHGLGLGARLVERLLADARALDLPRVIALTREVGFFERAGFSVASRDALPRCASAPDTRPNRSPGAPPRWCSTSLRCAPAYRSRSACTSWAATRWTWARPR